MILSFVSSNQMVFFSWTSLDFLFYEAIADNSLKLIVAETMAFYILHNKIVTVEIKRKPSWTFKNLHIVFDDFNVGVGKIWNLASFVKQRAKI